MKHKNLLRGPSASNYTQTDSSIYFSLHYKFWPDCVHWVLCNMILECYYRRFHHSVVIPSITIHYFRLPISETYGKSDVALLFAVLNGVNLAKRIYLRTRSFSTKFHVNWTIYEKNPILKICTGNRLHAGLHRVRIRQGLEIFLIFIVHPLSRYTQPPAQWMQGFTYGDKTAGVWCWTMTSTQCRGYE